MLYDKDDRMPRPKFLSEFGIVDSQEKRARTLGLPWPPYVILGRRIYYSRRAVQRWFSEQEAQSAAGVQAPAGADDVGVGDAT